MERLTGFLLFLPVPAVLWLFTQLPLGRWPSLGLGVALMVSHRFYARPWALRRKDHRCLWCGAETSTPERLSVTEPMGETAWSVCHGRHRQRLGSFLGWASRNASFLKIGIAGTLVGYLVLVPLAVLPPEDLSHGFRLLIAVTVLPLGWLGPGSRAAGLPKVPFPVHIQGLIGTWAVSWLFRIVGLVWLLGAILHFTGE